MGEVVEVGPGVTNLAIGDRVVVPFPIACGSCFFCERELFSLCENSNPNAPLAEKMWGHSPAGIFGYSHMLGGYAGGQAEYVRVPFADVGPLKVPRDADRRAGAVPLRHSADRLHGRGELRHPAGRHDRGVGLRAGRPVRDRERDAARRGARDRDRSLPRAAAQGANRCGAETLDYESTDVQDALKEMTGGRGPDACIDAVGMEAHVHGFVGAYDRAKQAMRLSTERPGVLRQAIQACRKGGTVSVPGVYGGFIDKLPFGAVVNKAITIKSGQTHVQRYMRPLLERIERGEIDPSFIVSHRLSLDDAAARLRDVQEQGRGVREGRAQTLRHATRPILAPVPTRELKPKTFASRAQLRAWLERNHATAAAVDLRLFKVHASERGVTYREALDEALCFGWIDGVRRALRRRQLQATILAAPARQQVEPDQSPSHARAAGCRARRSARTCCMESRVRRRLPAIRSSPSPSLSRVATCRN